MNRDFIKTRLAPCGLHCGKCFAFEDGDIRKNAKALKTDLGNFEVYAERFVELLDRPVFKKYPEFKEMLDYFAEAECAGCRKENCKLFSGCKVRSCTEEMKVDFCYECHKFPCSNTGFDEHLYKRYININNRIKEIGLENYYLEIKEQPRY